MAHVLEDEGDGESLCAILSLSISCLHSRNQLFYCSHLEGYKVCYAIFYTIVNVPFKWLQTCSENYKSVGYKHWVVEINYRVIFTLNVI